MVELRRQNRHPVHNLHAAQEVAGLARRELSGQTLDLTTRLVELAEQLVDLSPRLVGRHAEPARDLLHILEAAVEVLKAGLAGDDFNSPQPAADASLPQNDGRPDFRRVVHVGAATQLLAEVADGNHPHLVAILLAEDHHRAGLARLFERHHPPDDLVVRQNVLVDALLYLTALLATQRLGRVEVEAGDTGRDQRAALVGGRAEHVAQ